MASALSRNIVANRERSYRVSLLPGISSGNIDVIASAVGSRRSLLVTTPTVARLYANGIVNCLQQTGSDMSMLILACSEQTKTLSAAERLCHECFTAGLSRTSLLIGCGGGVCTDLVTMAASLARRGLNYIRIPTTLIGLIDASIGIKGAVNLPGKKSAIGCFHPPEHVFLDPTFLQTLPRTNIAEGLAEAIKVAIVMDRGLFELIEEYSRNLVERPSDIQTERLTGLVWRSAVHLLDELEPNIYEDKTYRRILDFGHTFSPLIESESGFCLSHGLAVSIDIALTTALACELGLLSGGDRDRILRLLVNAGLPTFNSLLTLELGFRALVATEAHRGGHLNLALPTQIGGAVFLTEKEQVPPQALRRALDFLREASLIVPVSTKLGPAVEPRSIATDLGGQERRFLST